MFLLTGQKSWIDLTMPVVRNFIYLSNIQLAACIVRIFVSEWLWFLQCSVADITWSLFQGHDIFVRSYMRSTFFDLLTSWRESLTDNWTLFSVFWLKCCFAQSIRLLEISRGDLCHSILYCCFIEFLTTTGRRRGSLTTERSSRRSAASKNANTP